MWRIPVCTVAFHLLSLTLTYTFSANTHITGTCGLWPCNIVYIIFKCVTRWIVQNFGISAMSSGSGKKLQRKTSRRLSELEEKPREKSHEKESNWNAEMGYYIVCCRARIVRHNHNDWILVFALCLQENEKELWRYGMRVHSNTQKKRKQRITPRSCVIWFGAYSSAVSSCLIFLIC